MKIEEWRDIKEQEENEDEESRLNNMPIERKNDTDIFFYKERENLKEVIIKHKIDLIVVGANCLAAHSLWELLKNVVEENEDEENLRTWVTFGSLEVPKLFATSVRADKLHPELKTQARIAVSLGRML
jgi:transcriptional accessory protein Tex/SPT6